ncbi:host-nuclease inhibitor Gam family protein [Fructilactobacillus sp. Tb1]|uniref:host-nuclease inhibitor Gam family protein n=1 Tax=Fructilactobacillus sp. Tb1 TaxID=3422304 RepID=UPI003D291FDF
MTEFEVTNDEQAMKLADKYKDAKDLADKNIKWAKETFENRQQQNQEWLEKIKNDNQARIDFYKAQLDAYAITLPGQKLDLPNVLITHSTKTVISYPKSKTELLEIAKKYSPTAIKTEEKVNWSDIKKALVFSDNGKAISKDGEVVKGIEVTQEPKTNITLR